MGKIADISKWQGDVDWEKAAGELDLVILRASCGLNEDVKYERNVHECMKCGIPFGAYHYVMAGTADRARQEARLFVDTCKNREKEPAFWIADIEYEAQTETTTEPVCVAFLEELREQGCGKIGLYINRKLKWAGEAVELCDIMWIPHWGKNDGNVPADAYKPDEPHDIWQYTSKGRLAGVEGNVDLNLLTGTKPLAYFTGEDEETDDGEDGAEMGRPSAYVVTIGMYADREAAEKAMEKVTALGFDAGLMALYAEEGDDEPVGVEIGAGTWNVRSGPGTAYGILGIAREGEVYEATGDLAEGWVGILYKGERAWISQKGVADT